MKKKNPAELYLQFNNPTICYIWLIFVFSFATKSDDQDFQASNVIVNIIEF